MAEETTKTDAVPEAPQVMHTTSTTLIASDQSEWGKLTDAQKDDRLDKAVDAVQNRRAEKEGRERDEKGRYKPAKAAEGDEGDDFGLAATDTKTPANDDETPVVGDAAEPEKGESEGKEVESETIPDEWLDEETRDLASAMGLSDDDLSEFGSKKELERALRLLDRKAFEAGKAAAKPAGEKPQFDGARGASNGHTSTTDVLADLSRFKLGDQWDEEAAKPVNAFIDAATTTIRDLQTRIDAFEQSETRRAAEDVRSRALQALHSLGHADLFGKPGEKPTREQQTNIDKAIDAHYTHARGLIASGRSVAPTPAFLKAAVQLAFGDQLTKQTERQVVERLRKQSSRRTGGGAGKPMPQKPVEGETTRQMAQRIASDPEVQAIVSRFRMENMK